MKLKRPLPDSPAAWLRELAEAYLDAQEAIPFEKMTGDEFGEESLFHLAPAVCLKFRGYKPQRKKLQKATEAALSRYVASQEISGDLPISQKIFDAFLQERNTDQPNYSLFRRYFKESNNQLKKLILRGLDQNPNSLELLSDLFFHHQLQPNLGELVGRYMTACKLQEDLEAFTHLAHQENQGIHNL